MQPIDEDTQLLVQVDKVSPNWLTIFSKALLTNEYQSFTDLFDDTLDDTAYKDMPGIVQKGTNIYIDIDTIMDSTSISYSRTANALYNKNVVRQDIEVTSYTVTDSEYADGSVATNTETKDLGADYYAIYSFSSPYYVMLDQLVANINEYNSNHNVQTYTAAIDSKGNVITYDVSTPYLLSNEFLEEGYDIFGLTDILMCENTLPKYTYIFGEEDKELVKYSAWYPDEEMDEQTKQQRIKEVYDYARAFVEDHIVVYRHIPDSIIVKSLAFAAAIKYNEVFHCHYADSIKLIRVDNRDLIRFMLGTFNDVYSNYSYTFGRYVYRSSGTVGVILAAILCVIVLVTTVLKPVLIMLLFALIIINIAFREILFDKPNQGVEGYFIGCAIFMAVNFIYAGLLKACFAIADSSLSNIASMIMCILVQILYLIAMAWLVYVQISDWRSVGFNKYAPAVGLISGGLSGMFGRGGRNTRGYTQEMARQDDAIEANVNLRHDQYDDPQEVTIVPKRRRRRYDVSPDRRSLDDMRARDQEREISVYDSDSYRPNRQNYEIQSDDDGGA